MKTWKLISWLAILIWVAVGIYGIFYNLTYVDEAKYLIKGWLITTGKVGYYSTKSFFYQHMPGGLLWYGLGQKFLGPNLILARIQSFVLGLLILGASFLTAKKLFSEKAGVIALALLSLTPIVTLYYSSAVPQSLAALMLGLGFLSLVKEKRWWATVWFSLSFISREQFIFTLVIYLVWLFRFYRKEFLKHLVVSLIILTAFMGPGMPRILNVIKNFPGINTLMPISQVEKEILSLHWQQQTHGFKLYFRAIKEFGVIYFIWFLAGVVSFWKSKRLKIKKSLKLTWLLLVVIFIFNFLAHGVAAFQISPRAIVSYFGYTAPMAAVIVGGLLSKKIKDRQALKIYLLALLLVPISMIYSSIFTKPDGENVINEVNRSAEVIKDLTEEKEKIVWLAEPMSLYLAGRISYYPLINHTNLYKPLDETETIRDLGFWNQEIMAGWLKEADMVVWNDNRLKLLNQNPDTKHFPAWFEKEIDDWKEIEINYNVWPKNLRFVEK